LTHKTGDLMTVDNPDYYKNNQSKIECIEIFRHLSACRAAAIKYLWRLGQKDLAENELKKALWYLRDELQHNANIRYTNQTAKFLLNKMDTLAIYQDENTSQLFFNIVFGNENGLKMAIAAIEGML
jgi:hypothetical protein